MKSEDIPVNIDQIQRVNVIGTSGSGKSTFARQLALILDLPYVEMDDIYWGPNWTKPDDDVFFANLEKEINKDRWVLDGNYSRTTPIKWQEVQLIIWLDMPFWLTLSRVTKRAIQRSMSQEELWPGTGNRETLRKSFLSRDSIILWSITSYRRNRQRYAGMMTSPRYRHLPFLRLTSPQAVERFLDTCSENMLVKSKS